MMTFRVFIIFVFVFCSQLRASIDVRNGSQHPIRFSFHGDGCRIFDSDRFDYKPCAERIIQVNETAHFKNLLSEEEGLSRKEKAIVPRIIFSFLGFSYACKLRDLIVSQLCSPRAQSFRLGECPKESIHRVSEKAVTTHPNSIMLLHASSLSISEDYYLEILSDYGYFPKPYVDCRLTHFSNEQSCYPL